MLRLLLLYGFWPIFLLVGGIAMLIMGIGNHWIAIILIIGGILGTYFKFRRK